MECIQCSSQVSNKERNCPSCGADCGFPNVRMAQNPEEISALKKRTSEAIISAKARGCDKILIDFGDTVKNSAAVIARPIGVIDQLLSDEKYSYISFQRQVDAGMRAPEDNKFDRVRTQYEEALYPYFSKEIIFASLSLSSAGMSGYGGYAMVLKDNMISQRATVFEENPHVFVEKHHVIMNREIPKGYRSNWNDRHNLAIAKLHSKFTPATTKSDYSSILETDNGGTGNSDWIEVHIYGSINRNAIKSISGKMPKIRADKVLWRRLKKMATQNSITVIEF